MCVDCVRLGKGIYRRELCLHRRPPWLPRLLFAIHVFDALVYGIGLPILALRPYGEPIAIAPRMPAKMSVLPVQVAWPRPFCPCSNCLTAGTAEQRCCRKGMLP